MKRIYVLALLLLTLNGCAAMLIADSISSSSKATQRQQFIANYDQMNQIRAGQGLPPLDWCSECYWFDHNWAKQWSECARRIKLYKKGDETALEPPGAVRPIKADTTKAR